MTIKIIKLPGTQAARIQAPLSVIRHIAKDPLSFPLSLADPRLRDSEAILTATYSKLYYQGGGWWFLVGYSFDGSDVTTLLAALTRRYKPSELSNLI